MYLEIICVGPWSSKFLKSAPTQFTWPSYPMMSPKVFSRIASNNPKHQHNHKGMIVCKTQIKSILRVYDHIYVYIYIWTIVRLYNYRFNIFKTPYIYGDPKLLLENTCWSLLPPVPIDSQQLIEGTDLISILPGGWFGGHWWEIHQAEKPPNPWKLMCQVDNSTYRLGSGGLDSRWITHDNTMHEKTEGKEFQTINLN